MTYRHSAESRRVHLLMVALTTLALLAGCVSGPAGRTQAPPATASADSNPRADSSASPRPSPSTTSPGSSPSPSPSPAPASTPAPSQAAPLGSPPAVALDPAPAPGPFSFDLYRPEAHVAQFHPSWCVGSSMQMMINLMEPGRPDRSRSSQKDLYQLARDLSPWEETAPGASIFGWMAGLELLGHGRFQEMATDTRQEALRTAARQMRLTGKPVGLWVWGGKHAWVVSGFRATADPAYTDDFRVSHLWIEDPWAGRDSAIWGPGLAPHTLLTARQLGQDFLPYANRYRPQYGPEGKYTIIAPVA